MSFRFIQIPEAHYVVSRNFPSFSVLSFAGKAGHLLDPKPMFRSSVFSILLLISGMLSLPSRATVSSSLPAYLKDAQENAPRLKELKHQRKISDFTYESVATDFSTTLSLGGGLSQYRLLETGSETNGHSLTAGLRQGLPLGFDFQLETDALYGSDRGDRRQSWTLELNKSLWPNFLGRSRNQLRRERDHQRRAEKLLNQGQSQEFCLDLIGNFASLFFLQEQLRLESEQLRSARDLLKWAERAYRERRRLETDLNNARKTVLEVESSLQALVEKLENSRRSLHRHITFEFETAMDPRPDISPYLANLNPNDEAFSYALEAARENHEASLSRVAQARSALQPSLTLAASLEEVRPEGSYSASGVDFRDYRAGIVLSYPLFDAGLRSELRTAKITREISALRSEQLLREREITWINQRDRRKRLIDENRRQADIVRIATAEEKTGQRRLRNGQIDFINYGLLWSQRVQSESDWLRSQEELFRSELWLLGATRKIDGLCALETH